MVDKKGGGRVWGGGGAKENYAKGSWGGRMDPPKKKQINMRENCHLMGTKKKWAVDWQWREEKKIGRRVSARTPRSPRLVDEESGKTYRNTLGGGSGQGGDNSLDS